MFVSVDLLGPTEMILSFAQYLSKYHVHPHMFSLMFVILDYTRKKVPNLSFSLERWLVYSKVVSLTNS